MLKDKLSVIIPTLQLNTNVLIKLLTLLQEDDAVDEILVINNHRMPLIYPANLTKVQVLPQEKNLYVNPSWNLGISLAKNDKFLVINDDILVPNGFCSAVVNTGILDNEETGLVGLDSIFITNHPRDIGEINVPQVENFESMRFNKEEKYLHVGNWGSAFFGVKSHYYNIPEEFKIIYGDNYILKKNLDAGRINLKISGIRCNHITSLSSQSQYADCVVDDIDNAHAYFGKENVNNLGI